MLVVLVGFALLVSAGLLTGCGGPKVPDVVGMRQEEAVRALQEAGYLLGDVSLVSTDSVPLGTIAAQSPAAGERARKDSAVGLAIAASDGTRVQIPTVVGMSQVTAEQVATALNLVPLVTDQYSDQVVKGEVAAQSPEPGAEASAGSTLVIVMSKGPAPEKAKVPDVVGKKQADAESAIEGAGFSTEVFKVYNSDVGKGKVIGQLPEGGDSAVTGSDVQIVVSLGTGTGAVKMPSVTGKKESSAVSAIEDAGLTVQTIKQYDPSVAKGVVSAQFPDAGATAAKGSEAVIVVSLGAEPTESTTVPGVIGSTADAATTALKDVGLTVTTQELPSDTPGTVVYQFPESGAKVTPGSEVLIVVGVAK
jgi:serine/threonine-protein kinase